MPILARGRPRSTLGERGPRAQAVADGKGVGWFQGRSEWGPRALGNRSIVCDPRHHVSMASAEYNGAAHENPARGRQILRSALTSSGVALAIGYPVLTFAQ